MTGSAGYRQAHRDARANADFALDLERAPMPLDDVLDDREAKAGSARAPASRRIDAVESFGQSRQVFAGDSRPVVGYRYDDPPRRRACRDVDCGRRIVAAIADGIAEEIVEDLEKLTIVAFHRRQCLGDLGPHLTLRGRPRV